MEDNHNSSKLQEGAAPPPAEETQEYIPVEKQNNTLGIISLVAGIIALVTMCCFGVGFIPALVAIICGFMAKSRNQKFAVAGLIMGFIAAAVSIVVLILYIAGAAAYVDFMEQIMQEFEQFEQFDQY